MPNFVCTREPCYASHGSYTFQALVFHDNNGDFKSRMLFVGGERCLISLFKPFVERRPLLKHPFNGLFLSTLVANKTDNLNTWFNQTKAVDKNTITNTMKDT